MLQGDDPDMCMYNCSDVPARLGLKDGALAAWGGFGLSKLSGQAVSQSQAKAGGLALARAGLAADKILIDSHLTSSPARYSNLSTFKFRTHHQFSSSPSAPSSSSSESSKIRVSNLLHLRYSQLTSLQPHLGFGLVVLREWRRPCLTEQQIMTLVSI